MQNQMTPPTTTNAITFEVPNARTLGEQLVEQLSPNLTVTPLVVDFVRTRNVVAAAEEVGLHFVQESPLIVAECPIELLRTLRSEGWGDRFLLTSAEDGSVVLDADSLAEVEEHLFGVNYEWARYSSTDRDAGLEALRQRAEWAAEHAASPAREVEQLEDDERLAGALKAYADELLADVAHRRAVAHAIVDYDSC
jgi:hypothetical protein